MNGLKPPPLRPSPSVRLYIRLTTLFTTNVSLTLTCTKIRDGCVARCDGYAKSIGGEPRLTGRFESEPMDRWFQNYTRRVKDACNNGEELQFLLDIEED